MVTYFRFIGDGFCEVFTRDVNGRKVNPRNVNMWPSECIKKGWVEVKTF